MALTKGRITVIVIAAIFVTLSALTMTVRRTKFDGKVHSAAGYYILPVDRQRELTETLPTERKFYTIISDVSSQQSISAYNTTSSTTTSTSAVRKEIVMPGRLPGVVLTSDFEGCQYSNCVYRFTDKTEEMGNADVIVIEFNSPLVSQVGLLNNLPHRSILLAFGHESPGYSWNRWKPVLNKFNGSVTYSRSSSIYFPYGAVTLVPAEKLSHVPSKSNYAEGKTKGAYAYVSNCRSMHYNRLEVMKKLSKYINLDIYGQCTHNVPCKRGDTDCEASLHPKYRFYLAFENSLCKDYITEKFWKTLRSSGHFIPVVIGGLSIEDYNKVSPPDSFIHAYNFSSIDKLGQYLNHLSNDDVAYNKYHQWRDQYETIGPRQQLACDLCEIAHNPNRLKSEQSKMFADEWNNPQNCRNYEFN